MSIENPQYCSTIQDIGSVVVNKLVIAVLYTVQHLWGTWALIRSLYKWVQTVQCNMSPKGEVWAKLIYNQRV